MAKSSIPELGRSALLAMLADQSDDVLKDLMRMVAQGAINAGFDEFIGAEHYGREEGRQDYRNGSRQRTVDTRMGTIELQIPRARESNFVPPLLEHRKRSERALVAAVQEMVINGVSNRKVERVLNELGVERMSKSQVSVLCAQLDVTVRNFRERRLEPGYPYLMFDAIYVKVRADGRVGNQAIVIAYAVNEHGVREVIGVDLVLTESRESWTGFMRSLIERGLHGVRLVVSDAHEGLKAAIATILPQAQWQRCRVHFLRNILAHIAQHRKLEMAAAFRSILSMETADAARLQAAKIIEQYGKANPKAMEILGAGLEDVLSFFSFPAEHHRKLWSSNPIEHLNGTIRKRTNVVGIFPNADAAIRLISMILIEQTEDWVMERNYMSEASMQLVNSPNSAYTRGT